MTQRNYAHDIEQIRAALHHPTGSRASVMIGAGFSFNAQKRYVSARSFPSWASLTESLVRRLYPDDLAARDIALRNAGAVSGALRLAQEFEAAFGRTLLMNHVQDMIPDKEYEPGHVHQELLKLNWADVFTTNYDTLLERASIRLRERRYEIVRCVTDLPLKHRPRIVKLHGTLPELTDCVLTEEDYRKYPTSYGPFVAELQVAMVESHLCLIGFSGDDPNFLAWSGWVRDRLDHHTLPIYLLTFDEPTTFQVRMLDERRIVPLPLFAITEVTSDSREEALLEFFRMLAKSSRPAMPRWCHSRYPDSTGLVSTEPLVKYNSTPSAEEWVNAAVQWQSARKNYPGWMFPHVKGLESLWTATESWANSAASDSPALKALDPPTALFVLFELVWRLSRAAFTMYDDMAIVTCPRVLADYATWRAAHQDVNVQISVANIRHDVTIASLDAAALELQLERLRHARETGTRDQFERIINEIELLEPSVVRDQFAEAKHFCSYQNALLLVRCWNDPGLIQLLTEWDTTHVPLWALRRAGLLIEIGEIESADRILKSALADLRAMVDEGIPETWAIESWITYLLRLLERNQSFLKNKEDVANTAEPVASRGAPESKQLDLEETLNWLRKRNCDPVEVLEWLDVQNTLEFEHPQESRTKSFDHGYSRSIKFHHEDVQQRRVAAYRAFRLVEDAGVPYRSRNLQIGGALIEKGIRFLADINSKEALGAVMRLRSEQIISEWFTRYRIASASDAEIEELYEVSESCLRRLVEHPAALLPNAIATRRFHAAVQLLSRVAVRIGDDKLLALLPFAVSLPIRIEVWNRFWFGSAIDGLIQRIWQGLSLEARWKAIPEILRCPVPGSSDFPSLKPDHRIADPFQNIDLGEKSRSRSNDIAECVDQMIKRIQQVIHMPERQIEKNSLVVRLAELRSVDCLSLDQQRALAVALFQHCGEDGLPVENGVLDAFLLSLPAPTGINLRGIFAKKFITTPWPDEDVALIGFLDSLIIASTRGSQKILWTDAELHELAIRCRGAIEKQLLALPPDEEKTKHPLTDFFGSPRQTVMTILWRISRVIDDVLLAREVIQSETWEVIVECVRCTSRLSLPGMMACPKMASFDSIYAAEAASGIVERLCSKREDHLIDGCKILNHWANGLNDSRFPPIPDLLISAISSCLDVIDSSGLNHIIDTVRNLIVRLPDHQAIDLFNMSESRMRKCAAHLVYNKDPQYFTVEFKIRELIPLLREAMTKLCVAAKNRGIGLTFADEWIESIRSDKMPEIRDALADLI